MSIRGRAAGVPHRALDHRRGRAARAFAQVNDVHAWAACSPDEKNDPMQRTFDAPRSGAGATYAWAGNREIGEVRMTIGRSGVQLFVDMDAMVGADFEHSLAALKAVGEGGSGASAEATPLDGGRSPRFGPVTPCRRRSRKRRSPSLAASGIARR
ncbi:MAG TPA: hypothetical protein VFD84_14625 [Candidatus Binatia bacterium]|nr:hypothetical protein [Candidatus Binatia bacterium]